MKIKAVVNTKDSRQDTYIRFLEKSFPEIMNEENPDMYYVVGGDGAMLHAHKDYGDMQKPFFGKGLGTLNFIMHNFDNDFEIIDSLLHNKTKPTIIKIPKIEVVVSTNGLETTYKSINDVIIGGCISDWNSFEVTSKDSSFNKFQFNGTGICISTPLGSSAFNINNGGKLLPIDSKLWSITNVVSNKNIDELIKPQKLKIRINSLRSSPNLFIDGLSVQELNNGDVVKINKCTESFEIGFIDPKEFFAKRMKLQQEKR